MIFQKLLGTAILGASTISAQAAIWGQCGGNGWTGSVTCTTGGTCKASNEWYSQCIPDSNITTIKSTTTKALTTKASPATSTSPTSAPTTGKTPKLLICSDSTTANYAVGNALQGWGYYINNYTTLNVVNLAKNGRSTRSFIAEGLWATLLSQTSPGDFVLIEMGHNDDVDPTSAGDVRGTLPGLGEETVIGNDCTTVHTFGWYLRKMIADVTAKNGVPIISGMVHRNYWTGDVLQSIWRFADDAATQAKNSGVEYLDHTKYGVALFQAMGPTKAKTFYPNDNTHTNWPGALLGAETFVTAVKCKLPTSQLYQYLNAKGLAVVQHCFEK